jgi:hypothetical protein
MKISRQITLVVLTLIIAIPTLASGCTGASAAQPPAEAMPAEGLFQVTDAEGNITNFSRDDLKSLTLTAIWIDGKSEEGPTLQAVLNQAGVDEFEQVTLTGASGSLTLMPDQVDPEVILDLSNRGTVQLAAPTLPKEIWIKDITVIMVE